MKTMAKVPSWESPLVKFLRWVAFLPIAFLSLAILHDLPIWGVNWAANYKPEFSLFLMIIIGLIVVAGISSIVGLWFMGVFFSIGLTCGSIAPNKKLGSTIFGTIFYLVQLPALAIMFFYSTSLLII